MASTGPSLFECLEKRSIHTFNKTLCLPLLLVSREGTLYHSREARLCGLYNASSVISLYTFHIFTHASHGIAQESLVLCWHACKVTTAGTLGFWHIQYLLILSTVFQRDSAARHWIFICMAQAIKGHSGALAGRSISYYSMKLTFSLQAYISLPQRGSLAVAWETMKLWLSVSAQRDGIKLFFFTQYTQHAKQKTQILTICPHSLTLFPKPHNKI